MPCCRALLVPLLALVLAAPAQAGKITYGSDLSGDANLVDKHPRDWAAWPTATTPASNGGYTVTQQGEVTQVSVKGTVPKPEPDNYGGRYPGFVFHIVVLRPQSNGDAKLMVSTENLVFPFGGDPQQITTFNLLGYQARMCAEPGDIVAIATSGGFGNVSPQFGGFPDNYFEEGYPVQMFSRIPTSSYGVFKQPAGDDTFQVNDTVSTSSAANRELLMRTTIGTGADARFTCRTKAEQAQNLPNPNPNGTPTPAANPYAIPTAVAQTPAVGVATVVKPRKAPKVKRGKVKLGVKCSPAGTCTGTLGLRTYSKMKPFTIAAGKTAAVTLKLNRKATKKLKRKGAKLTVKAMLANTAGTKSTLRFKIQR